MRNIKLRFLLFLITATLVYIGFAIGSGQDPQLAGISDTPAVVPVASPETVTAMPVTNTPPEAVTPPETSQESQAVPTTEAVTVVEQQPPVQAEASTPEPVITPINPAETPGEVVPATTEPVTPANEQAVPETSESQETNEQFIGMTSQKEITPQGNVSTQNLISITLDKVPLEDVVRMFMRISDVNIIVAVDETNLMGTVTANLADVPWEDAFKNILNNNNLDLEERPINSGMYTIIERKPGTLENLIVQTVFLKYASVGTPTNPGVAMVVSQMLDPRGKISEFPSRNAIIIRTTASNLKEIQKTVEEIDKLCDQVFIEAKFMELNDAAISDLGINWQALQGYNFGVGNLNRSISEERNWKQSRTDSSSQNDTRKRTDGLEQYYDEDGIRVPQEEYMDLPEGTELTAIPEKQTIPTRTVGDSIEQGQTITSEKSDAFSKAIEDARTAVIGADDFKIILSALKQMSGVEIVSNPKIIVSNEETAQIHIGRRERPFISTVTPASQNSAPFTTYNPGEPVDFGVILSVTPTVNTESNITVRIDPELIRSDGEKTAPNGQTYPVVVSKKITTKFCLESGKTVAIGGLTETIEEERTTKVPLLGSIPFIGKYLFSHSHKEKRQTETIIFVTVGLALPDGMDPGEGLPQDTELTQKAQLRKELKRKQSEADLKALTSATAEESAKIEQSSPKAKLRLLRKRK